MKKNKSYLTLPVGPRLALGAAILFSITGTPVLAQQIFNGEQTLQFQQPDYRPASIYLGFGQNQDATLNLVGTWILSGGGVTPLELGSVGARWADSDGSGTNNTAILNIDSDSQLQTAWDVNGLGDIFSYDGTLEINIDGTVPSSFEPDSNLRTRRVAMAVLPGSSATVNLVGPYATWDAWQRHIDAGIGGTATINVSEGARIINAQRLAVGGTRWTATSGLIVDEVTQEVTREAYAPEAGGTGILNITGPDSRIDFANNSFGWLRVGRRSTGIMTVSNGAFVNLADNTVDGGVEIWVGDLPGGDGTLIIESGGIASSTGAFRIASQSSDRGYVKVDGIGSQLNITGGTSFLGNSVNPESIGIMEIVNGGSASFLASVRIGNQETAEGEVTVDGPGSELKIGNFLQVAWNGTARMNVINGGTLDVGKETTTFSAIGRSDTGRGIMIVSGTDSKAIYDNSLFIATGSNAIDSPGTGTGVLEVRNGGLVEVGNNLAVRGAGSIVLDSGTIRLTGSGIATISGENTSLTGDGVFETDLVIANEATIEGAGAGILLTGTLSGTGAVQNFTLGGIDSDAATGSLALNNVRFVENAPVNLTINDLDGAPGLIAFDGDTDFAGTHLMITFDPFAPSESWSAQLFNYTGAGAASYNFSSVTTPEGWVLEDGLLRHSDSTGPTETAFEQWLAPFGLSGLDATTSANPAGDGHTNVAKFAFGVSPIVSVPTLVEVSSEGGMLTFRWNRRTNGVNYLIEDSSTLVGWTPVPGASPVVMAVPDVTPPDGYERVEWSVDIADEGDRSFYRVSGDVNPDLLP